MLRKVDADLASEFEQGFGAWVGPERRAEGGTDACGRLRWSTEHVATAELDDLISSGTGPVESAHVLFVLCPVCAMLIAVVFNNDLARVVHEVEPADPAPFVVDGGLQLKRLVEPEGDEEQARQRLHPRVGT